MPTKPKKQRTRSRNGCATCRNRHIKCDEGLPTCKNCQKSNRTCLRGSKYNFFRSVTAHPQSPPGIRYGPIKFLDQSFTLHKLYNLNPYHDYTVWFKWHSEDELRQSDQDFENSIEWSGGNMRKDSEDTASETSAQSGKFSQFSFFAKQVLQLPQPPMEQALFIHHQVPRSQTLSTRGSYRLPTLDDFVEFVDDLSEMLDSNRFHQEFKLFISSLNLCIKVGHIHLFRPGPLTTRVIEFICFVLTIENWNTVTALKCFEKVQTYENLMNVYEILLLDLNHSLLTTADSIFVHHHDNFMLERILQMNLFDDLNYFLVAITSILMMLNNLHHHPTHNTNLLLDREINKLKQLENNQYVPLYFPHITPQKTLHFASLNAHRLSVYYIYTIVHILQHFALTPTQQQFLFLDSPLQRLWNSLEPDLFRRLSLVSSGYDFRRDPFMNFVTPSFA